MRMGLDSLMVMQLLGDINEKLDIKLGPTTIFNFPTIDALVNYISNPKCAQNKCIQPLKSSMFPVKKHIGIIGMSCRLPGGIEGPAQFWEVLQHGHLVTGKVPFGRWDVDALVASTKMKKVNNDVRSRIKYGGFIDDLDMFDASAFRI